MPAVTYRSLRSESASHRRYRPLEKPLATFSMSLQRGVGLDGFRPPEAIHV